MDTMNIATNIVATNIVKDAMSITLSTASTDANDASADAAEAINSGGAAPGYLTGAAVSGTAAGVTTIGDDIGGEAATLGNVVGSSIARPGAATKGGDPEVVRI